MAIINALQDKLPSMSCGSNLTILITVAILFYFISLAVYRLYVSPLAKFPGPKLAALTSWVEIYYEITGEGGMFCSEYAKWHEKYGR
jgi:hypothetical protein